METTEQETNCAHEAIDKIASATCQAVNALGEKSEQLINAEQELIGNCRNYVRDNPVASLGIAVAAGFLLSRVLSGR